jgi:hypothetical protein
MPVVCGESGGGSVSLEVTGSAPPYRYIWADTNSSPERSGLRAGQYHVTVEDAKGCRDTISASVGISGVLQLLGGSLPVSCFGGDDGRASVRPFNGVPPFEYRWSTGSMDSTLWQLRPGLYSATVSDAYGCTGDYSTRINMPDTLVFSATVTGASGDSVGDGAIRISGVVGGNPPYQYEWSTGAVTQEVSMLLPGIYTVTVTDDKGCQAVRSLRVPGTSATAAPEDIVMPELWPNPADEATVLYLPAAPAGPLRFVVTDAPGRVVLQRPGHRSTLPIRYRALALRVPPCWQALSALLPLLRGPGPQVPCEPLRRHGQPKHQCREARTGHHGQRVRRRETCV